MQTCLAVRRLSCFSCWHPSHVNPRALLALPEFHCVCRCVRKCVVLQYGLCTPPLGTTLPGQCKEWLNGVNTQPCAPQPIPPSHLSGYILPKSIRSAAAAVASAESHGTTFHGYGVLRSEVHRITHCWLIPCQHSYAYACICVFLWFVHSAILTLPQQHSA